MVLGADDRLHCDEARAGLHLCAGRAAHRGHGGRGCTGGLLLALVPVGPLFILIIAAITFVLPWLAPRNYALTAFAITPLVLVLIDFLSPARSGMQYADLRLLDTLMGCAIVLLFGYLLWPRRHASELQESMAQARQAIAHYLQLVLDHRLQPESADVSEARRAAYGKHGGHAGSAAKVHG